METKPLRLFSYTRSASDQHCERARYYAREWGGTGLQSVGPAGWALVYGNIGHQALEELAKTGTCDFMRWRKKIEEEAPKSGYDQIAARDWGALMEGQLRGFCKAIWPFLLAEYEIVEAEKWIELEVELGLIFRARQDLLLRNKFDGHYCYCVDQNTRLLTADLRWVPAGQIAVGDTLAGVEEYPNKKNVDKNGHLRRSARHWQSGKVLKTKRVIKTCYELILSDGTKFTCSDDHSWLVARDTRKDKPGGTASADWVETKNLKVGAKLLKVIEPWDEKSWEPYDAGYIGAALDGEACLIHRNPKQIGGSFHLTFSQKKNAMLKKFKDILSKYSIYPKTHETLDRSATQTNLCRKANVLRILGISRPERLLKKLDFNKIGGATAIYNVTVVSCEPKGTRVVVAIETTCHTYIAEGIVSHNCDYKFVGNTDPKWIKSWNKSIQMHSSMYALNQSTGCPVDRAIVIGLNKGYEDRKTKLRRSPFTYGYANREFSMTPAYSYEYQRSRGWELFSTAAEFSDLSEWVAEMPAPMLSEQLAQTAPIFLREDMAQEWLRQQAMREGEVADACIRLAESTSIEEINTILARHFRQNFDKCEPAYGFECEFRNICWIPAVGSDPLSSGQFVRYESDLGEKE